MNDHGPFGREYEVPIYRAPDDAAWYHFLYGSVPGHQIDFIVRPELPHDPLSPQHFSHLLRLIKYIESRQGESFAFAIANLSRDDTQHVPGHGGLALIFGLRVRHATDHTGRPEPPFSHVIAAIDRELDSCTIEAAALSFYRTMVGGGAGDSEGVALYRSYAALAGADPGAAAELAARYVEGFEGLPRTSRGSLGQKWRAEEPEAAKRIVVVHPDGASFSAIAACAARLAAILYRSDVRWTSITTGREADVTHGVSIFLVPEREARSHSAGGGLVVRMSDIPLNDAEVARALFGARAVERRGNTGRLKAAGFREPGARAAEDPGHAGEAAAERPATPEQTAVAERPADDSDDAPTLVMHEPSAPAELEPRRPGAKRWPYAVVAGSFLCAAALAFAWTLPAKRAFLLEPLPLEPPARPTAASPSALPEKAPENGGVKQEELQVDRAAMPASQVTAPAKSPPQRTAVGRGAFGRRTPEEPKALRNEKATPAGPIYRDLPSP